MAAGRGAVSKVGDISLNALFGARVFVLALFALTALGGLIESALRAPTRPLIGLAFSCAVAAFVATVQLRHGGLAALAAGAPLPGLLAVYPIAAPGSGEMFAVLSLCYALAFTVALFLADDISARIVAGADAKGAAPETMRVNGCAISAVAAVAAISLTPGVLMESLASGYASASAMIAFAAAASAAIVVPLGASMLPYDEDFVSRANRAGEWRARMLEYLVPVTRPRYGWSVSGVALVFLALAIFGSLALRIAWPARSAVLATLLALAPVLFVASFATLRDWRRSIAVVLALAPANAMGSWALSRLRLPLGFPMLAELTLAIAIGFALVLFVALHAGRGASTEDEVAAGSQHAMACKGSAACAAAIAVVVGSFCSGAVTTGIPLDVIVLFAALGSVVFQPAFTIAIETLAPRRSTIEHRYRMR